MSCQIGIIQFHLTKLIKIPNYFWTVPKCVRFSSLIPFNETITVFDLPYGACPPQAGNNLIADTYDVSEVFANKPGIAEVVIVVEEILPVLRILYVCHWAAPSSNACIVRRKYKSDL
ncbi:hypothetical protein KsCSTR_40170 [Candidatus Kuenenia stuttgartiensis]|uniref:Uncharacterized protein n=1 Tax=Kuenenia stuttgartiensis TaxID=174633 RepID=A0A6G7GUZ8_KUEST|nr:hypothetical protein KsCSTR_40170 [Candidatus Kuenenia stuttgartiensis]